MERLRKKRVVWTDTAVNIMLNVFEEKRILEYFDGLCYRNQDIFKIFATEIIQSLSSNCVFTIYCHQLLDLSSVHILHILDISMSGISVHLLRTCCTFRS